MNLTALHEAAHAVVGTVLDHPVALASIIEDEDRGYSGKCWFSRESRAEFGAGLAMLLAGEYAVAIWEGREPRFNYLAERGDAEAIRALEATLPLALRSVIRARAEGFAEVALMLYWEQVLAVARKLERERIVTGGWVERLVKPTKQVQPTKLRVVGGEE